MSLNPGRAVMAAAAVLALVAAGGFAAAVFGQRPLWVGGDGETTCIPGAMYPDVAFGVYIANSSKSPLTLTAVEFGTLEGLDVSETWIARPDPQDDGTILGYGAENYPPTEEHPGWAQRVPLNGAIIEPGEVANIVLRVETTGEVEGRLEGVTVRYVAPSAVLGATGGSGVTLLMPTGECL